MAAICHHKEDFFRDVAMEVHVELCAEGVRTDMVVEVPQTLESDLHQLGFLMLHCKNYRLENGLE